MEIELDEIMASMAKDIGDGNIEEGIKIALAAFDISDIEDLFKKSITKSIKDTAKKRVVPAPGEIEKKILTVLKHGKIAEGVMYNRCRSWDKKLIESTLSRMGDEGKILIQKGKRVYNGKRVMEYMLP